MRGRGRLGEQVRADWTRLGAEDPLWAVWVDPDKRGGRWDVEEFLALGRDDVERTRAWLSRLGLPTEWDRVLDFGCGAGRLSQALAPHAREVVGLDVSGPMLARARELDRSGGRCRFVLAEDADLHPVPDASVDLVLTERVLQHLPPGGAERALAGFLRVLRPGGVAVLHCPTTPLWTARGVVWRVAPTRLVRWAQTRLLGYPAPMLMTGVPEARVRAVAAAAGGRVVDVAAVGEPATHWAAARYVVVRDAG
ncbi:class I SAM-dependent methyltransferase [Geodermatophilus sp. SYSU D01119]